MTENGEEGDDVSASPTVVMNVMNEDSLEQTACGCTFLRYQRAVRCAGPRYFLGKYSPHGGSSTIERG